MEKEKFKIQDNQYNFPYHFIPYFNELGAPTRSRILRWGYKYLCYLLHIKNIIESLSPNSVLEVGCGEGRLLHMIDSAINRKVGADVAEKPILFAKAFSNNIEFHCIDAKQLNERFDVVVAMEVLEHIPDDEVSEFFNTLADRTVKGGHVIISTPTVVQPLNKKHYRHYTISLFKEQLEASKADLNIKNVDYVYRSSPIIDLYLKVTSNRLWHWDIYPLNKIVWQYIWNKLRLGDESNGQDLVVTLVKY